MDRVKHIFDPDLYLTIQRLAESEGLRSVVGGLIVHNDRKVFVMKRSSKRPLFPDCWDIPGGHVEPGESLFLALEREIMEETGWKLMRIVDLVDIFEWQHEIEDQMKTYLELDFLVEIAGDLENPHLEFEKFTSYRWVRAEDLDLLKENRCKGDQAVYQTAKQALALLDALTGAKRRIEVVPHNPAWHWLYRAESGRIADVFRDQMKAIEYIGSTAIPGIYAKPVIDIMPVVKDIEKVNALNPEMEKLGYLPMGEYGIPGRRFFIRVSGTIHRTHVHVFQEGNPEIERVLNFRDYLIAHPEEAQAYSRLKIQLAVEYREDPTGYTDAKSEFIRDIDQKATVWRSNSLV